MGKDDAGVAGFVDDLWHKTLAPAHRLINGTKVAKWDIIDNKFFVWSQSRSRADYTTLTEDLRALRDIDPRTATNRIRDYLNLFGRGYLTRSLSTRRLTSFRASRVVERDAPFTKLSELWSPKAKLVKDWGRFNRPKQSVFYMSSDPLTALAEVQSKAFEHRVLLVMRAKNSQESLSLAQIGTERLPGFGVFKRALGATRGGLQQEPELQAYLASHEISANWLIQDKYFSEISTTHYGPGLKDFYKLSCLLGEQLQKSYGVLGLSYPTVANNYLGINTVASPEVIRKHFYPLEAWLVALGTSPKFVLESPQDPRAPIVIRRGKFDDSGNIRWGDDRRAQSVHTLHVEIAPRKE